MHEHCFERPGLGVEAVASLVANGGGITSRDVAHYRPRRSDMRRLPRSPLPPFGLYIISLSGASPRLSRSPPPPAFGPQTPSHLPHANRQRPPFPKPRYRLQDGHSDIRWRIFADHGYCSCEWPRQITGPRNHGQRMDDKRQPRHGLHL
jgi:hypothetical protein